MNPQSPSTLPAPIYRSSTREPTVVPPLFAWTIIALCIASLFATCLYSPLPVRENARRSVDSSNLRQIGQSCMIYASDHQDQLPQVDDIHAFATALAKGGGLNDGTIWITGSESSRAEYTGLTTVITPDRQAIDPAFAAVRPSFAAVVRSLNVNLPSTTPVAWTRGLRPDGTWSEDSPYGGEGGHIVFLGGNVQFYRKLTLSDTPLLDRDGNPTTDIRAALPPDAVIANN